MNSSEGRREMNAGLFRNIKRKSIRLAQDDLIKTDYLEPDDSFLLVIQPNVEDLNLTSWADSNREFIETELINHGAILFRNFKIETVKQFEQFAKSIAGELLDYRERAAPRTEVGAKIYTSTEYPADQHIPLHHEMSYSHNWPTKIWFYCNVAPQQGGRTPVANDRKVIKLLNPRIKESFMQKRVMYVRNYGEGVDLSWQEAFQTDDRSVVEEYCRRSRAQLEWRDGDRLRTRQIRQAVATHPKTDEVVWFNHAHLFHISNVEPSVRESLLAEFSQDELPRNAFYGDGTPIETSVLDEIRGVYLDTAVWFTWQVGDVLMLDNFLVSHGREPFSGPRKILVAMAELYTNPDI